jgi:hypothetical protein
MYGEYVWIYNRSRRLAKHLNNPIAPTTRRISMAAKASYKFKIVGDEKNVLRNIGELAALKPHKWIPYEEINTDKQATLTPRQADWLSIQIAKRVKGSTITFAVAPAPATAQPA